MYDGWAVYDSVADRVITQEFHTAPDITAARNETISFAAYRVLRQRFSTSPSASVILALLDAKMDSLGYNRMFTSTVGDSPAAVGNRIAANVLAFGLTDGANEQSNYAASNGYQPVNQALIVGLPGDPTLAFPNRWQPLALTYFYDQNGHPYPGGYPAFVCPHWGHVTPFAMTAADADIPFVYHDPGPPPLYNGVGDAEYRDMYKAVVRYSSWLTPDDGIMIDISPGALGNNTLGTNDGTGHPINPYTGQPYEPNIVKRGDFARVLAEFWADGPNSETPPGHWNVLANYVTDYPGFERRMGGTGPILDNLEWDVKMYLALNGAVHDAAVTAWGIKGHYDTVRPISAIRFVAGLGQSSDPDGPSYHPGGIPLEPGLVEVITPESSAPGQRHEALAEFVGEIAIFSWPGNPQNPSTEYSGVRWMRAATWVPYQLATFVTPPFAGYISGHSTYSRSAAEVMTQLTGTEFFPGGMAQFVAPQNTFLRFELGPTETITLQWGTYFDAADQAGISRLYGGIHPRGDDFPGRIKGREVGLAAWARALQYFFGATLAADVDCNEVVDLVDAVALAGVLLESDTAPCHRAAADMNRDGVCDGRDVSLFVHAIAP